MIMKQIDWPQFHFFDVIRFPDTVMLKWSLIEGGETEREVGEGETTLSNQICNG